MTHQQLPSGRAPELPEHVALTPSMRRADTAFSLTVRQKAIMLIDGPPGTGKTTASARWAAQAEAAGIGVIYVAIPERPSPTELLRLLIEAVSGVPSGGTKHEMENEVRALLSSFGGLLIVDEVQNLRRSGMQELRYIHDDSQTDTALLLSGWQAEAVVRERPDLDSRIGYRAVFAPLAAQELPGVLAEIAPWLDAEADTIHRVDTIYGKGILRRWHRFLSAAHDLVGDAPLTQEIADDIVGVLDPRRLAEAS